MADVIVLGGGMAGVTAARHLKSVGLRVLLLEASRRVGGRIHTLRDMCDMPVEAGAELIHGAHAQTWPDVRAAGLTVRPNSHSVRAMMVDLGDGGRWLPLALLNPQTWHAFGVLRRVSVRHARDMSAREFIEQCGYRGRARSLAEMVFSSHMPGRLEDIGVHGFLDDGALELETSADYRINEGYDRLVDHIGRDLDVEFGFEVQTIEWSPDGVALRDANGRTRTARAAISTLPVGVLQSEAIRFIPELPESKRTALRQIVMGPVSKLIMRFDEPFWPRRLATLISATGPVTLYWNVFYNAVRAFPVLTAYCTGPRAATLCGRSEDEFIACVVGDLRRHFPRSNPKLVAWRLVDWSREPYARGGYSFLRPGAADARAHLAAADSGALFWAGSETATEPIAATVGGAFSSGLRAAREVLHAVDA